MSSSIRIALAQQNLVVGDVPGNTGRILSAIRTARDEHRADLVLFAELALCGYPPEDLLFQSGLRMQVHDALEQIRAASQGIAVFVGYPEYQDELIYNSGALFLDGALAANYRKQCLPNYDVFDEERYFVPGRDPGVVRIKEVSVGLTICEDIWEEAPAQQARASGAELLVSINGSPFKHGKQALRDSVIGGRCRNVGLPLAYQNMVGGQDELVFDGGSSIYAADGTVVARAGAFVEDMLCCEFVCQDGDLAPATGRVTAPLGKDETIYAALVTGVRDYVRKNGFPGVVLGLSGGIDSALTLVIAADALGAENVQAVMMPYRYTAQISQDDAEQQARALGVDYRVLPIESMVNATNETLHELFAGLPVDTTEENIQSRCRGLLLMAISNKTGRMVLATGNKSEMAVGYATLYGDMAGGFAPIKDCTKTLVYRLARYRNTIDTVIPTRVIERPPSAELAPDQKDSDSLPDYDILDPILDALMYDDLSEQEIVARGFDEETVARVLAMVRRNEYKRRQAAPGVRISGRAFGRDWRYPITSGYR